MAASTTVFVPVEEYLRTVYRPDCDYVDGAVEERNWGELDHGLVQTRLPITELRVRVSENKFRVPDLVVTRGKPAEQVLTNPPLLCVEILSPEDRPSRINRGVYEYLEFGVPAVWVVDPTEKLVWIYRPNGMEEATGGTVKVDGTTMQVPFSEIFD